MSNKGKKKTLSDVNGDLIKIFDGILDGSVDLEVAKNATNVAGKMVQVAKTQMMYHAMRGEVPECEFMSLGPMKKVGANTIEHDEAIDAEVSQSQNKTGKSFLARLIGANG